MQAIVDNEMAKIVPKASSGPGFPTCRNIADIYVELRSVGLRDVTLRDVIKAVHRFAAMPPELVSPEDAFLQLISGRYGSLREQAWKGIFGLD